LILKRNLEIKKVGFKFLISGCFAEGKTSAMILYQVAIKRVLFFDKVFAGYAGKNLINSSSPPLGRGQGEGELILH